jgi:hypothetical protein
MYKDPADDKQPIQDANEQELSALTGSPRPHFEYPPTPLPPSSRAADLAPTPAPNQLPRDLVQA